MSVSGNKGYGLRISCGLEATSSSWNYDELGLYNMYKTVDTPKPGGWLTLTVGVEVLRPNVQRNTSNRLFGRSSL